MPKIKINLFVLLISLIFITLSCEDKYPKPPYAAHKSLLADSAMVVCAHPLAAEVGLNILKKGGNATDATIAIQFALAVVYPRAGNIGGGGFMIFRTNDGQINALDYREKAPEKASADMYLDEEGNVVKGLSTAGHLAVGVPGTVDGMFAAHKKYGHLPMADLINPAIKLAAEGFGVSATEAARLNKFQEAFTAHNDKPNAFIKKEWATGDALIQPELAHTLALIRDKGEAGFYEGETAAKFVAEINSGNGIISLADLKNYNSKWRKPITGNYKNYRIISMPPPSSGGIALVQMLKIVQDYPLNEWGFQSTEAVHLMVEAERRVYADRAEYLGDADFYDVPVEKLLDSTYLKTRMADYVGDSATVSEAIHAGEFEVLLESFETTHTSVVDKDGNAVSVTTTLNSNFGSKVVVDGAGFFLNNEMDDFSAKPGVPNQFGLVGAEANAIKPHKRMLSSMTPTIVEKDGQLFMVLGTPGGSTIITGVFQVFLNVAEFGLPVDEAVAAPRFHHQWLPDHILIEGNTFTEEQKTALTDKGHTFHEVKSIAKVKAIHVLGSGRLQGGGDPRNADDAVLGY